eukprot:SAG11_NODE_1045_length_6044_cov_12.936249_3_plen_472_part_00
MIASDATPAGVSLLGVAEHGRVDGQPAVAATAEGAGRVAAVVGSAAASPTTSAASPATSSTPASSVVEVQAGLRLPTQFPARVLAPAVGQPDLRMVRCFVWALTDPAQPRGRGHRRTPHADPLGYVPETILFNLVARHASFPPGKDRRRKPDTAPKFWAPAKVADLLGLGKTQCVRFYRDENNEVFRDPQPPRKKGSFFLAARALRPECDGATLRARLTLCIGLLDNATTTGLDNFLADHKEVMRRWRPCSEHECFRSPRDFVAASSATPAGGVAEGASSQRAENGRPIVAKVRARQIEEPSSHHAAASYPDMPSALLDARVNSTDPEYVKNVLESAHNVLRNDANGAKLALYKTLAATGEYQFAEHVYVAINAARGRANGLGRVGAKRGRGAVGTLASSKSARRRACPYCACVRLLPTMRLIVCRSVARRRKQRAANGRRAPVLVADVYLGTKFSRILLLRYCRLGCTSI